MLEWLTSLNPDVNWEEAMVLLVVRFIGVILVMLVMQVALQLAASVIGRIEKRDQVVPGSAAGGSPPAAAPAGGGAVAEARADEGGVIAAIAVALDLEQQRGVPARRAAPAFSAWSAAGLAEAHDRLLRSR